MHTVFPYIRDFLLKIGLIWHKPGRQEFQLGFLKVGVTEQSFHNFLQREGFEKNIIAWIDEGEVLSVRKRDVANPGYHYHIRLFYDGEVRAHYEKTPEAHPIDHFLERGLASRRDFFLSLLHTYIDEELFRSPLDAGMTMSHRAPVTSRGVPTRG